MSRQRDGITEYLHAYGQGTLNVNNCKPYCSAVGKYSHY